MSHDVFISYSKMDRQSADRICDALESHDISCWIAPRDVLPGLPWGEAIIVAIEESRLFFLLFSSHSNKSPQVTREVERAVAKNIPLIPFRIEDFAPSKQMEYFTSSHHWLDASDPPTDKDLKYLVSTVKCLLGKMDQAEAGETQEAPLVSSTSVSGNGKNQTRGNSKAVKVGAWGLLTMFLALAVFGGMAVWEKYLITPHLPVVQTPEVMADSSGSSLHAKTELALLVQDTAKVEDDPEILQVGIVKQTTSQALPGEVLKGKMAPLAGDLRVTSKPSSVQVIIDGATRGVTPCLISDLEAGRHSLSLVKQGYQPYKTTVKIRAGHDKSHNAVLKKRTFPLTAQVKPSGMIYIDGKRKTSDESTPFTTALSAGSHVIAAQHLTWGRWTRKIHVDATSDLDLTFDFGQKFNLRIISEPMHAKVYVNGILKEQHTPCLLNLRPGDYEIMVAKDGYETISGMQELTLEKKLNKPLKFILRKVQ